jgi:hypothetical protein
LLLPAGSKGLAGPPACGAFVGKKRRDGCCGGCTGTPRGGATSTRAPPPDAGAGPGLLRSPAGRLITLAPPAFLARGGHGRVIGLLRLGNDVAAALTVGHPDVVHRVLDAVQPGLAANIHPVKMRRYLFSKVTSSTSTKVVVCGLSVGGRV